jgi:hypothetical protein
MKRKVKIKYVPPKLESFSGLDWVDGATGCCTTGCQVCSVGAAPINMWSVCSNCSVGAGVGAGCSSGSNPSSDYCSIGCGGVLFSIGCASGT